MSESHWWITALLFLAAYAASAPFFRGTHPVIFPKPAFGELLARYALGSLAMLTAGVLVKSMPLLQLAFLLIIICGALAVCVLCWRLIECCWKSITWCQVYDGLGAVFVVWFVVEMWLMALRIEWP